jgi:hypothetical protein
VRLFEEVAERERERERERRLFLICRYMEGDAAAFANKFTAHCNDPWGDLSIVYSMNEYLDDKKNLISACVLYCLLCRQEWTSEKVDLCSKDTPLLKENSIIA